MSTIKHIKVGDLTAVVEIDDISGVMLGTPVVDDHDPTPEETALIYTAIINKTYTEIDSSAESETKTVVNEPAKETPPVVEDENRIPKYMKVGEFIVLTDGTKEGITTIDGHKPSPEELETINKSIADKTYTELPDITPEVPEPPPVEIITSPFIDVRGLRVEMGPENSIVSVISIMQSEGEVKRSPTAEEIAFIEAAIVTKTYVIFTPRPEAPPETPQPISPEAQETINKAAEAQAKEAAEQQAILDHEAQLREDAAKLVPEPIAEPPKINDPAPGVDVVEVDAHHKRTPDIDQTKPSVDDHKSSVEINPLLKPLPELFDHNIIAHSETEAVKRLNHSPTLFARIQQFLVNEGLLKTEVNLGQWDWATSAAWNKWAGKNNVWYLINRIPHAAILPATLFDKLKRIDQGL
jgi:hypothetical protein